MPSQFSQNLGIELITPGEQFGSWGLTTNNNIRNLESAITGLGIVEYQSNADLEITITPDVAANVQVARNCILKVTSTVTLTAQRDLIVPQIQKTYLIWNQTLGGKAIRVKTGVGIGVIVPNGARVTVFIDGVNVYTQSNYSEELLATRLSVDTLVDSGSPQHYPAASTISMLDPGNLAFIEGGVLVGVTPNILLTALWIDQGVTKEVTFTGSVRLVNGPYFQLPSAGDLDTSPGDVAWFRGEAGGTIRCIAYTRKSGNMISGTAHLQNTPLQQDYSGMLSTSGQSGVLRHFAQVDGAEVGLIEYCTTFNADLVSGVWQPRDLTDTCWVKKWSISSGAEELWVADSDLLGSVPVWRKISATDPAVGSYILGSNTAVPKNTGTRNTFVFDNVLAHGSALADVTGTLKITLPTSGNGTILNMEVSGYDHLGGSWRLLLGGKISTLSSWDMVSASCSTSFIRRVRFGYDGLHMCVLINSLDSVWSYPQVVLKEVVAGFSAQASSYGTGWNAAFVLTESGIVISGEPTINPRLVLGGYRQDDVATLAMIGSIKQDLSVNPTARQLKSGARSIREYNDISDGGSHGITAGSISELATTFNAQYIHNPAEVVTLRGATSGSTNVISVKGTDALSVGMKMTFQTVGLFPQDTYITAIDQDGIHITVSSTASQSGVHTLSFTQSWVKVGTTVSSTDVISMLNTIGLGAGMKIQSPSFPPDTYILSVQPGVSVTVNNLSLLDLTDAAITCDRYWARDLNTLGNSAWMRRLKETYEEETWVSTLPSDGSLDFIWTFVPTPLGVLPPFPVTTVSGRIGDILLTGADVGLPLVENKSSATIRSELTGLEVVTSLGFIPENPLNKDQATGYAGLDINGKINPAQFPFMSITNTFVVPDEAAMLALTGVDTGDVAVRLDVNRTFILKTSPASALVNWQELLTPTDLVLSVNGLQGAVTLTPATVGAAPATHGHAQSDVVNLVTDLANKSDVGHAHVLADITGLGASLAASFAGKIDTSLMGAANGVATLGADLKIPANQLPSIALTDTFVVNTQTAMLALAAQTGDVAIRSDINKTYILAVNDPTVLSNWKEVLTPASAVTSVNGLTGSVTITAAAINASPSGHGHAISNITDLQNQLGLRGSVNFDLTGVITAQATLLATDNGTTFFVDGTVSAYTVILPVSFADMRYGFIGVNGINTVQLEYTGNLYLPDGSLYDHNDVIGTISGGTSVLVTSGNTSLMTVGDVVTGAGIPVATTIATIADATHFTLSAASTNAAGVTLSVYQATNRPYTGINLAALGNFVEVQSDGTNVYLFTKSGQQIVKNALAANQAVSLSQANSLYQTPAQSAALYTPLTKRNNRPQVIQSAAYTTVASDASGHLLHPTSDATARTFTIDSNANVPYDIGTELVFVNQVGAGVLSIAIAGTDTLTLMGSGLTGTRTLAVNGIATALKITATSWVISGTNLT